MFHIWFEFDSIVFSQSFLGFMHNFCSCGLWYIFEEALHFFFFWFPKTFLHWIQTHMGYGFNKVIFCNLWILWMPLSRCVHDINFHSFVCISMVEETIKIRSTNMGFLKCLGLLYCLCLIFFQFLLWICDSFIYRCDTTYFLSIN